MNGSLSEPADDARARLAIAARRLVAVATVASVSGAMAAAAAPSLKQREAAARQTANQNAQCVAVQPFRWSVGDATGQRVSDAAGRKAPGGGTVLQIASASKWIYGAYVAELRQGVLTADDVHFLTFSSGYTQFDRCLATQTVAKCQSYQSPLIHNGGYVAADDGLFDYGGGHMQKHATLIGLGPDKNAALAATIGSALGGFALQYSQPQLAGGVRASAKDYGVFLQHIVAGDLRIGPLLGANAVCTNPSTCATAVYTPLPQDESWHYSIGHWVEDDPVVGDGAFSSAGAFGFYPWIDAGKKWWGIVARETTTGQDDPDPHRHPGVMSMYCGRQIRAAWLSGKAQ